MRLLLIALLLLPSTVEAQGLVTVRDVRTGRMRVVQVWWPAQIVEEPARRSPAFEAHWRNYEPPKPGNWRRRDRVREPAESARVQPAHPD